MFTNLPRPCVVVKLRAPRSRGVRSFRRHASVAVTLNFIIHKFQMHDVASAHGDVKLRAPRLPCCRSLPSSSAFFIRYEFLHHELVCAQRTSQMLPFPDRRGANRYFLGNGEAAVGLLGLANRRCRRLCHKAFQCVQIAHHPAALALCRVLHLAVRRLVIRRGGAI